MIPCHNQDGFIAHCGRQGLPNGAAPLTDVMEPPQGPRRHHQLRRSIPGFLDPGTVYAFDPANYLVYTLYCHNDSFIEN
jgi:hypothetical protein